MKLIDDIIHLRHEKLIKREWKRKDIREKLESIGRNHSLNTINTVPSNFSVAKEGEGIGNTVKNGTDPKFWRGGPGLYELIEDPDDDPETQQAQMRRAIARAKELRENNKGRSATMHPPIAPTSLSSVARSKPEIPSFNVDSIVPIALTEAERKKMEDLSTEQKALNIVRARLRDRYGEDVEIEEDGDGVDLRVTIDGKTERIEVKGTKDSDIAWQKLKVSSKKSHDALVSGDASIYRVVDVDSADPRVHILIYGEDFTLEPEPRWSVKRILPDNERYPMRGLPYRYDRPHDPVALDDWEILK